MIKKKLLSYQRSLKDIIEKRFNIMTGIVIIAFTLLAVSLIVVQIGHRDIYQEKLKQATEKIIKSDSVPRGRIYDRNYNLLVDNVGKKTIYYQKPKGIKIKDEVAVAYEMASILDVSYNKLYDTNLREFWLINNAKAGNKKITNEEYQLYKERKLSALDLRKLKLKRITEDELSLYNEIDKEAAYIYYLMNKGYAYDEKIIKNESVTDEEYAYISENVYRYKGFNAKLDWERKYLYGDVLKGVLGNISNSDQGLPYEMKDDYLKKGYSLNDRVGLSNLEYQYEYLLKGTKSVYQINYDNSMELLKQGIRGKDIVLTIDINLQKAVEQILEKEMLKAKKEANTDYYNRSFVIISDPFTGDVLAYAAKQIVFKDGQYNFYDYSPLMSTTTITAGSVVKGASISVGYDTRAIEIGTRMLDECIKLKNTPAKCSWKEGIGVVDDIGALKVSSNAYQFKIAMKVGGATYKYNMPLVIDPKAFDTYRNLFVQFGLGVKTGIDLPFEGTGYKGGSNVPGHLLDFAIGQYDTYTPLQLSQYINTIANGGSRIELHFLKEVHAETMTNKIGHLESTFEPVTYNKVKIENKYINRVREGFREVIATGIGRGYMGNVPSPAGKTGTSQSFVDSDNDGKVDKETISNTFAGYFPSDHPVMSIIVASPDVYYNGHNSTFRTSVNMRIASSVSNKFYEFMQLSKN